jgi:hypothetical protein
MTRAYQPFDPYEIIRQKRTVPPANSANPANPVQVRSPQLAALAGLAAVDRAPPQDWQDALTRLEARARPDSIPTERWTQTVADAGYLVREWAAALDRCGWTLTDVFSAHREKPLARYDAMGLVLLVEGRKIGPIDADRIAIRQRGGTVLHFRHSRLPTPETRMLWDLS